jgi:hypothetical protein
MTYEFITLDTGDQILKGTDSSGQVWWIPQDPKNTHYKNYLKSLEGSQE